MKYCKNCGQEIIFDVQTCPNCKIHLQTIEEETDSSTTFGVWAIILGLVPLFGWIIGGLGLKKAFQFNNKKGKLLNGIGIVLATISFLLNVYLMTNGYVPL